MKITQPSPLRYPGGKGKLFPLLKEIIYQNSLQGGVYAEPYAGGASSALQLLMMGHISKVLINDADYCIFSFWKAALDQTEAFTRKIRDTPLTIDEWRKQREIYRNPTRHSQLKVGFASFFLNRCNRSGILVNGGPIGGIAQKGEWKIDARFNRTALIKRVQEIAEYGGRVEVSNDDALVFLRRTVGNGNGGNFFAYLDPPYYVKGSRLYLNHYGAEEHAEVAKFLESYASFHWVMTYDDVPEIRKLYRKHICRPFRLSYSAHSPKSGNEVLIAPSHVKLPC